MGCPYCGQHFRRVPPGIYKILDYLYPGGGSGLGGRRAISFRDVLDELRCKVGQSPMADVRPLFSSSGRELGLNPSTGPHPNATTGSTIQQRSYR